MFVVRGSVGPKGRATLALPFLLLAAACATTETVDAPTARPAVRVTDDQTLTRTHEAANLLIDWRDPDVAYLAELEMQNGECRFYVSTARGSAWRQEAAPRLEPYTNCNFGSAQPQNIRTELKQDAAGTIYYVFAANDRAAGGTRSVLLGRSGDRGKTWSTSLIHGGPKATTPEEVEVNFEAHIAFNPEDPKKVYAIWRRSYPVPGTPPRATRPFMAVSEDGGATFRAPFMMVDKNIGFDGPRPILVGDRLYAFYRESAPPAPAAQATPSPGASPAASPPPAQVTRLWAAVSADDGRTWKETEISSAPDASEPIPLYDAGRKTFHVVWHDNRNKDLDVFYSSSTDGTTWREPRRINDDRESNRVGQYYPQIALSPGGRLDVAWYDYRDDPFPAPVPTSGTHLALGSNLGKFQGVYMTSSTDGGRTWRRNVRVNDVLIDRSIGTWNGEYFVVVPVSIVSWDEGALVAWSDTRNGNAESAAQDIYTGFASFGPAAPAGRTGTLQLVLVGAAGLLLGAGLAMWGAVALARRRRLPAPAEPAAS